MTYYGTIITESLKDAGILKTIKIVDTRTVAVTEKHQTPWLEHWTHNVIEIPDDQAHHLAKKISHALDDEHNWYADFKNGAWHYIIFRNKIFRIDRKKPEQYRDVSRYGISLGIPSYQLDFSPNPAMENAGKTSQSFPSNSPKKMQQPRRSRKSDYVTTLIITIALLYIFNNLIKWEAQLIINDKWLQVLPVLNISLSLAIVANMIFLFYHGRIFHYGARMVLDLFSLFVTYRLYTVFPFDFRRFFELGWLNTWFPYLLLLGTFGLVVAIVVRTARFISGQNIHY
jgi:hypothetical protein